MDTVKPTIVVTGVSGSLAQRLLPQLADDYEVVGIDVTPPAQFPVERFVPLDLGVEESARELLLLLREVQPASVVHLAFVIDPQRTGVLDIDRMWQTTGAGPGGVWKPFPKGTGMLKPPSASSFFPAVCRLMAPTCPSR